MPHLIEIEFGQIYIPAINWALMIACIGLVVGFRSSTTLAAAYGVAVTATMVITTMLFYVVAPRAVRLVPPPRSCRRAPGSSWSTSPSSGPTSSRSPTAAGSRWSIGAIVFTLLTTWRTGRQILGDRIRVAHLPLAGSSRACSTSPARSGSRAPPSSCSRSPDLTPPALITNQRHNDVLHERVVIVAIATEDVPRVLPAERSTIVDHGHGVVGVTLHYGFMEEPDVPQGLTEGRSSKLGIDPALSTYFLGSESLVVTDRPGMMQWREHLFAFMSRNATSAANYFGLPADRTTTVGMQIEL